VSFEHLFDFLISHGALTVQFSENSTHVMALPRVPLSEVAPGCQYHR
jgi:hypothetical protein